MITIKFTDGDSETYEDSRIHSTDSGITVYDEGTDLTGILYPWHRIKHVRVDADGV